MALEKLKKLFKKDKEVVKEEEEKKEERQSFQFDLGDEAEKEVVESIKKIVKDCKDSRSEWQAIRKESVDLKEGRREPKSIPWEGCSNISTMVTTVACDLLHSKIFPMVWNENLIYWEGREKNDPQKADEIRTIMRWVVTKDMDMQDDIDDICQKLIDDGTIVVKERWDTYGTWLTRLIPKAVTESGKITHEVKYEYVLRERCFIDVLSVDRVYFPWKAKDKEYVVQEEYYTLAELREMQVEGMFKEGVNVDDIKIKIQELVEPPSGTQKSTLDAAGVNPVNTRVERHPIKTYEAYWLYDWNKDGVREECVFMVFPEIDFYASGKPLSAISRVGKRPFVIKPFLRRAGCSLGKGIPELVRSLHKEMDAIHNQRIDAGNMAIAPFFFYRAASGTSPGRMKVAPATGNPLDDPERDVRFPTFPTQGLQVSFQEERLVLELIERLTYLTPAMLGKETAERPTARGTLAVMAQGEQKFVPLGARTQKTIMTLLTDIRQKYEENMPPDLQRRILGKEGNPIFENLSPETIAGGYDCIMTLDLTAGNIAMEKQTNLMQYQMFSQNPLVLQNPARFWRISADALEGLGKKDVEARIGPKPPTEDSEGDAAAEFDMIAQGMTVNPQTGEDHAQHLVQHQADRNSEKYESLEPKYQFAFNQHIVDTKRMEQQEIMMGAMYGQGQAGLSGEGEDAGGAQGPFRKPAMGGLPASSVRGFEGGGPGGAPVPGVGPAGPAGGGGQT